ncbi:MAG: divergent PAP2 family protein [Anaerolineales bacterium]|jgi:acid phosphatase family membrane protein YuiD|nr:divergent PAP2 family protein [Anaerolineales bacterium]
MSLASIFLNKAFIAGVVAWSIAQTLKLPIEYYYTRRWNWALLLSAGGMPSSHSALVSGTAHAIGLYVGFNQPLFALAFVVAAVVIYDAMGIRRQAGIHAEVINALIEDLAAGHPLKEEQLREVLGHTPLQALVGTILGMVIAQIMWFFWR